MRRQVRWWTLVGLVVGLSVLRAEPPPDDPPDDPPGDAPAANDTTTIGPGDEPGVDPIDAPGAGEVPPRPDDIVPPLPPPERRQAHIMALEPNAFVRSWDDDHKAIARGRLQLVIPDDEVILYCNAVDYAGDETGEATLTGDLRVETGALSRDENGIYSIAEPENVLTGEFAYVFTKEKRIAVDGNVIVVHRPLEPAPPDADEVTQARHDVTTVYCDLLNYWYRKGDRKAVLQPRLPNTRIRFEQATRRGTAGLAKFYDFEEGQSETGDVLDLHGNVVAEDDKGQMFKAELCRLYVDLDEAHMHNVQQLVINLDEDELPPPATEPPPLTGGEPVEPAPAQPPGPTPPEEP